MDAYRLRSRYSRWDGTQQINALTADDIMKAIAERETVAATDGNGGMFTKFEALTPKVVQEGGAR